MSTAPLEPKYTNADIVREVINVVDAVQDAHVGLVDGARKLQAAASRLESKLDPTEASVTPEANKLPRADANGKLDAGWLPDTVTSAVAEQIAEVRGAAQTAQGTADTAKNDAATAQGAAEAAQSTADTAKSNAATAKTAADNAQSTATTALNNAATAKTAADAAQSTANTANADSGVTAGSYGLASDNSSGTFSVPYIIVNSKGKITQAANHTVSMPAAPQVGLASGSAPGMVQIGNGLKITPEGILYLDPWDIFPLRAPLAVQNVKFSGRNPIMPGETAARTNWLLCDGGTDGLGGNVPDLRGRFLLGSDASYAAGSSGGSASHTHSLSGTMSGTIGATTLSVAQLASHTHTVNESVREAFFTNPIEWAESSKVKSGATGSTGSSQSHTHSLSISGGNMTATSASNVPPYYALAYLIRIK